MKKNNLFLIKAKSKKKYLKLELIRFEKTQPFAKESILAWFPFVNQSYSKSLSTIAIISAFISLELFPAFFLAKVDLMYPLIHQHRKK